MNGTTKTQRRSAKQKAGAALEALSGTPQRELADKHGATEEEVKQWVATFVEGGRDALRGKRSANSEQAELQRAYAKVGALTMRLEALGGEANGKADGGEDD